MKELNRQVVVFGNFNTIGFEVKPELLEVMKRLNMSMDAAPDIIQANNINGVLPIDQINNIIPPMVSIPKMRPLLTTKNRQFSVFIGTNRIHVEQMNTDTDSYNDFLCEAQKILACVLSDTVSTYINRLAVNGRILIEDVKAMDKSYQDTFKPSDLYGKSSNEFSFRINTIEKNEKLNNNINKIIAFNRTNEVLPEKPLHPIMLIEYDYNTVIEDEMRYNIDDLDKLIQVAKEFKSQIIK